jgi:hypothetical protein
VQIPIVSEHPYAMENTSLNNISVTAKQKPVQRHYQAKERRSFRGGDARRYSGNQAAKKS